MNSTAKRQQVGRIVAGRFCVDCNVWRPAVEYVGCEGEPMRVLHYRNCKRCWGKHGRRRK